jgi:hypothetical protein
MYSRHCSATTRIDEGKDGGLRSLDMKDPASERRF